MKKLLALILCVVMVLSLAPAAFAAYDHTDQSVWRGASQINDVIDALKTNTQLMYGAIAADTAVYQGIKSVDTMINDLVDAMMENYSPTQAGTTQPGKEISDAVIAGLRRTIGGEVSDYLSKHSNEYYTTDKLGNKILNPSAYAGVFAKALTNAVSSKKGVAGIQAYMYYILQRNAYEETAQQLNDLMSDVNAWGNWGKYGFDDLANYIAGFTIHMPGRDIDYPFNNIDGTMHDNHAVYQEYLTTQGMLGVDLDGDGLWNTGITGLANDILQGLVATTGSDATGKPTSGSENAETPLWVDDGTGIPVVFAGGLNNN